MTFVRRIVASAAVLSVTLLLAPIVSPAHSAHGAADGVVVIVDNNGWD